MKRVLIITYYWPPSGGAGVQRWLKFVKYLRDFGIEPIVYTPSNPEMPVEDSSLFNDVPADLEILKQPIWEPYHWYKKWVGVKPQEKINTGFLSESEKPKWTEKIGVWIRGNFFIPDARCFWIQPSISFLSSYLKDHPVDVIISTGPPHSMHRIALGIKKKMNIPWIADFRDPWTNIDFYDQLMLTRWADQKHHKMEREVLKNADHITTVTHEDRIDFLKKGCLAATQITNGYDDEFVDDQPLDSHFSLVHVGSIPPARNHNILWQAIKELTHENTTFEKSFRLELIGKTDISVRHRIQEIGIEKYVTLTPYMNHKDAVAAQQKAQVLLLLVNQSINAKSILTGKFFEYLAAHRPIVAIGPTDGEMAMILEQCTAGTSINFEELGNLKATLLRYFEEWQSNGSCQINSQHIEKYSRKNLTGDLSKIIETLAHD